MTTRSATSSPTCDRTAERLSSRVRHVAYPFPDRRALPWRPDSAGSRSN